VRTSTGAPSGFVWREIDDWPVYNSAQFGRRMRLNGGSGYFDCVYNVPGTCPGGFQTQFDLLKWADPRASLVAWAACQCSFESITLPDTSRASITCVCMCVCVPVHVNGATQRGCATLHMCWCAQTPPRTTLGAPARALTSHRKTFSSRTTTGSGRTTAPTQRSARTRTTSSSTKRTQRTFQYLILPDRQLL
jgi:hypothetical protein